MFRLKGQIAGQLVWLLLLVGLLTAGCVPKAVPQPNQNLVEELGLSETKRRLKEVIVHSINPQIVEVDVSADFLLYRYRQNIAGFFTGAVLENRFFYTNAVHVEVFKNNLVMIRTSAKHLIAQLIFGNTEDAILFADLVSSLRLYYLKERKNI